MSNKPFSMGVEWRYIWRLMEVSIMFYICNVWQYVIFYIKVQRLLYTFVYDRRIIT